MHSVIVNYMDLNINGYVIGWSSFNSSRKAPSFTAKSPHRVTVVHSMQDYVIDKYCECTADYYGRRRRKVGNLQFICNNNFTSFATAFFNDRIHRD